MNLQCCRRLPQINSPTEAFKADAQEMGSCITPSLPSNQGIMAIMMMDDLMVNLQVSELEHTLAKKMFQLRVLEQENTGS
jgi:hypothetical protein